MGTLIKSLSLYDRVDILSAGAKYDVCLASCNSTAAGKRGRQRDPHDPSRWIYPATMPGGRNVSMLKILMTNVCKNSCNYCYFSAKNDKVKRTSLKPEELAKLFVELASRGYLEGLFLSSGVCGNSNSSMSKMVECARIIRVKWKYKGYIHLKILPDSNPSLINEAAKYADRLSINLEAPNSKRLSSIAPEKSLGKDLLNPMRYTSSLIKKSGNLVKSQITQFVVGAAGERDIELLKSVDWLYREMHLFRSYFSSFQDRSRETLKINDNDLVREHRLYQSDFLLRGYGFRLKDMVFDDTGNLPSKVDPKSAWARMNPDYYPVDINSADEDKLLRVPGIGLLSAKKIISERVNSPFRTIDDLRKVGVWVNRAIGYIEFSGKAADKQNRLFEDLPPENWQIGITPLQKEKIMSPNYNYPGQINKPLYYKMGNIPEVLCR